MAASTDDALARYDEEVRRRSEKRDLTRERARAQKRQMGEHALHVLVQALGTLLGGVMLAGVAALLGIIQRTPAVEVAGIAGLVVMLGVAWVALYLIRPEETQITVETWSPNDDLARDLGREVLRAREQQHEPPAQGNTDASSDSRP